LSSTLDVRVGWKLLVVAARSAGARWPEFLIRPRSPAELAGLAEQFEVRPHSDWFWLQSAMDGIGNRDAFPFVGDVVPLMGPLSAEESVDLYRESMEIRSTIGVPVRFSPTTIPVFRDERTNAGLICIESDATASDFGRLKTARIVDEGAADEPTVAELIRSWRRSYASGEVGIDGDGWIVDLGALPDR